MFRYSAEISEGSGKGPVVVLVHGLAVSKKIWTEPENETLFAGLLPFRRLVADLTRSPSTEEAGENSALPVGLAFSPSRWDGEEKPVGFWDALAGEGYTTVTWSQRDPKGPVATAVEELAYVMELVGERFPGRKVVLLCHSRGGLVARRYLETHPAERARVAAFIGLGVPHRGSRLASFGIILSPVMAIVHGMTEQMEKNGALSARTEDFLSRLNRGLQSDGFLELVPDSSFIAGLKDEKYPGIRYISVIGASARYIKGYMLRYGKESSGGETELVARELFIIPDTFVEKMPPSLVPDELTEGRGDGQVAVDSARLPWADEEYRFAVNHAEMVVDRRVQQTVLDVLKDLKSR